jgi:hypothetical protein
MNRKYPIGQQDFRGIIKDGFMYVDKTRLIHNLIESGKFYFLSRPRRFGKSLLLSTIEEIFKGSKELFEGLWIYDNWNWERKYPVIHISFSDIGVQTLGLEQAIFEGFGENAQRLGISLTKTTIDLQLKELIQKAAGNSKVVILIDEYDKMRPARSELDCLLREAAKETYSFTDSSLPGLRLEQLRGRKQPGQCTEQSRDWLSGAVRLRKESIHSIGVGLGWMVCAN